MNIVIPKWQGGLLNKPSWDATFMAEAFLAAQRSIDPSTVHGSVWVSEDNRIISKGYNGPLQDSDDSQIPLSRPEKYYHLLHSEENCILNCNPSPSEIKGSSIYVTGRPCHKCLRMILRKGIKKIVYGPINSHCIDQEDIKAQEIMLKNRDVKMVEFNDMNSVKNILIKAYSYIDERCK